MGHDQDGLAQLAIELIDQRQYFLAGGPIEVARRLIGNDQRRVGNQRARDRNALLLTAG